MQSKSRYTLWSLAIPIAFEAFFQIMFGFADTFVLSSFSDEAVAGVSYANQIVSIVLLLFRVVASGTSILLAQAIGAQDRRQQSEICTAAFRLSLFLGLLASAGIIAGRIPLLLALKVKSALLPHAADYLEIMGIGLLFSSLFTVLTAIYRSNGKASYTSAIAIAANILNILGDFLVVRGTFHFFGTVKDVALVTICANGFSCLAALILLLSERNITLLRKPDFSAVRSILYLGIPAAGESFSYKCSQLVVTMIIGLLGTQALAAKIYGMNLALFIVLLPDAIAAAAGIMAGVQIGENNLSAARKTSFQCIKKGTLAVIAVDLTLLLSGRFLLSHFTQQPDILNMAYLVLLVESVTMFIKNVNLTLGNCLRALKDVHYPVVISVFSMWIIGTGLAWFLGVRLSLGLIGVFCAFFLDEGLRSLLLLRRWMQKTEPARG